MTEREKMLRGEQFETLDPQLSEDRRRAAALLSRLNALSMDAPGYREALGELLLGHAAGLAVRFDGFAYRHGGSLRRMSRSLQHDSARGVKKRSVALLRHRQERGGPIGREAAPRPGF